MNIILLKDNHQCVLATHVATFKVVRTRTQLQLQCVKINPQLNSGFSSELLPNAYQYELSSLFLLDNSNHCVYNCCDDH